jgi:hypothetical protein
MTCGQRDAGISEDSIPCPKACCCGRHTRRSHVGLAWKSATGNARSLWWSWIEDPTGEDECWICRKQRSLNSLTPPWGSFQSAIDFFESLKNQIDSLVPRFPQAFLDIRSLIREVRGDEHEPKKWAMRVKNVVISAETQGVLVVPAQAVEASGLDVSALEHPAARLLVQAGGLADAALADLPGKLRVGLPFQRGTLRRLPPRDRSLSHVGGSLSRPCRRPFG